MPRSACFPVRSDLRGLLALSITVAFGLAAAGDEGVHDAAASALLRLSGMERQIDGMPAQILAGMATQSAGMAPEIRAALQRLVPQEYAPPTLKRDVLARIRGAMQAAHAQAAMRWLESPTGRRITRLEEAMSAPAAMAKLQAYATGLQQQPPSEARLALVDRLDAVSGATELTLDLTLATMLAVAIALDAASASPHATQVLRQRVDGQRAQLRPAMREATRLSFLYAYRELPDGDLERYIAFLETDAGAWYNRTLGGALVGALTASATDLGHSLREALETAPASRAL